MNIKVNLNVCRVCLKSGPDSSIDIFTDPVLIEKFQYITQLKITKNDGMPELLCSRCGIKLKIAYDFRKQSLVSESQMRAFVNEMTREMNNKFELFSKKTDGFEQSEDDIDQLIEESNELITSNTENQSTQNNLIESTSGNILQLSNNGLVEKFEEIEVNDPNIMILKPDDVQYQNYRSGIQFDFICEEDKINKTNEESKLMEDSDGESQNMVEINESQDSLEFDKYFELVDGKDLPENISSNTYLIDDDKSNQENEIENVGIADQVDELEDLDTNDLLDSDKKIFHIVKTNELQYKIELKDDQQKFLKPKETIEMVSETVKMANAIMSLPKDKTRKKGSNSLSACTKCDKTFSSRTNLRRHELVHNDEKPYKCSECGAGFTQSGSLKTHVLGHSGIKPFKCSVCNESFTQSKTLKFHMRRHTGEKPFQCEFCQMRFRQKDCLKRHIKAKHPDNKTSSAEGFLCGLCGRLLHSKYAMDQHALKHKKNVIPLRCMVCKKTFNTKEELEDHQDKSHVTQFQCNKCSKNFSRYASLLAHMKKHLGTGKLPVENKFESNYVCALCARTFSNKKNLMDHMKVHVLKSEPVEVYRCHNCNTIYHNKEAFENHLINEHNESLLKFECSDCNIEFISDDDLNQHLNDKHDEINETCEICSEYFTSRKLYREHIRDHQILVTIE